MSNLKKKMTNKNNIQKKEQKVGTVQEKSRFRSEVLPPDLGDIQTLEQLKAALIESGSWDQETYPTIDDWADDILGTPFRDKQEQAINLGGNCWFCLCTYDSDHDTKDCQQLIEHARAFFPEYKNVGKFKCDSKKGGCGGCFDKNHWKRGKECLEAQVRTVKGYQDGTLQCFYDGCKLTCQECQESSRRCAKAQQDYRNHFMTMKWFLRKMKE